jgi:hypothetical protein
VLKHTLVMLVPGYEYTNHDQYLEGLRARRGEVVRAVIRAGEAAMTGGITAADSSLIPEEV